LYSRIIPHNRPACRERVADLRIGMGFVSMSTMRVGAIILVGAWLAGCAARPASIDSRTSDLQHGLPSSESEGIYEATTASALVFDPPVTVGEPAVDLSREDRAASAFVAFEDPITTYFWIHTDDYQNIGGGWGGGWGCGDDCGGTLDRYRRRAIIDTFGVTHR
jgi:hypothetical protein